MPEANFSGSHIGEGLVELVGGQFSRNLGLHFGREFEGCSHELEIPAQSLTIE
jgi:hypothetical protein